MGYNSHEEGFQPKRICPCGWPPCRVLCAAKQKEDEGKRRAFLEHLQSQQERRVVASTPTPADAELHEDGSVTLLNGMKFKFKDGNWVLIPPLKVQNGTQQLRGAYDNRVL